MQLTLMNLRRISEFIVGKIQLGEYFTISKKNKCLIRILIKNLRYDIIYETF